MEKTAEQIGRAYRMLDHIEQNPDRHDQRTWVGRGRGLDWDSRTHDARSVMECGTTACAAGWTVLLSGMSIDDSSRVAGFHDQKVPDVACVLLGLDDDEAHALFWQSRDLADVRKAVFEFFGPRPDGQL